MPQPYNYQVDIQDPMQAAVQGLQFGGALRNMQVERAQQAANLEKQKLLNQSLQTLRENPNPSAKDFVNVAMFLPEKEAASMRSNWDTLNKDQQDNELRFGGQVMSAISSGNPDVGIQLLRDRATAERNSGNEDRAKAYETYAGIAEASPKHAQEIIGILLGSVPGGDKVLNSSITAVKAPDDIRKNKADADIKDFTAQNTPERLILENEFKASEIKDLDSKIGERAKRLLLDRDKLQSDVELKLFELNKNKTALESDARKIINDSTVASISANQSAQKTIDLADKIEKMGGGWGTVGSFGDFIVGQFGTQTAFKDLRNEYVRLRNSSAMKNLPPGSSSDTDVKFAMAGFPKENADAETVGKFLRGLGKIQQYESATEDAKAEWVSSVGSLGKPKEDIVIGGVQVPAGTTFVEFMKTYGDKRAQATGVDQSNATVPTRSYMRWTNKNTGKIPGVN